MPDDTNNAAAGGELQTNGTVNDGAVGNALTGAGAPALAGVNETSGLNPVPQSANPVAGVPAVGSELGNGLNPGPSSASTISQATSDSAGSTPAVASTASTNDATGNGVAAATNAQNPAIGSSAPDATSGSTTTGEAVAGVGSPVLPAAVIDHTESFLDQAKDYLEHVESVIETDAARVGTALWRAVQHLKDAVIHLTEVSQTAKAE